MLINGITPIPLTTCNFHSLTGFSHQIIKSIHQRLRRLPNQSHNHRGLHSPNHFQPSMMVESLSSWLMAMMKDHHNTSSNPQNLNQNHNLKTTNVSVQINNPFHIRSRGILKQHLPPHRSVCFPLKKHHDEKRTKNSKSCSRVSKLIAFCFIQQMSQRTPSLVALIQIATSCKFTSRKGSSESVNNLQQEDPNHVHKVPILNPEVKGHRMSFSCGLNLQPTNTKVLKPNLNVETVKSCGQIETTSKHAVTKGKGPSSIFLILAIHKELSQNNSKLLLESALILFPAFNPMLPCIGCEERCQLLKSVDFRLSFPIHRHNSYRRPVQSNQSSWLQTGMQKSPKLPNKEDGFAPNKVIHSLLKSTTNFPSMIACTSFSCHITPPLSGHCNQPEKTQACQSRSSTILVKKQNRTLQPKHQSHSSLPRPRARVHQMIPMMRDFPVTTHSTIHRT